MHATFRLNILDVWKFYIVEVEADFELVTLDALPVAGTLICEAWVVQAR